MEGQIAPRKKAAHLMCGTRFWGVVVAIACAYFSYLSYSRLRNGDFSWIHDWWSLLTYGVWIALILGAISEVRCWRERILFSLILANYALGFTLSAWSKAPPSAVRDAREISMALWAIAAIASLTTLSRPRDADVAVEKKDDPPSGL